MLLLCFKATELVPVLVGLVLTTMIILLFPYTRSYTSRWRCDHHPLCPLAHTRSISSPSSISLLRFHHRHPLDFSVSSSVGGCSKALAKQLPSRIADFPLYPTCLLLTHCITPQSTSHLAQWTVN